MYGKEPLREYGDCCRCNGLATPCINLAGQYWSTIHLADMCTAPPSKVPIARGSHSPARLDDSSSTKCWGKAWQTVITNEKSMATCPFAPASCHETQQGGYWGEQQRKVPWVFAIWQTATQMSARDGWDTQMRQKTSLLLFGFFRKFQGDVLFRNAGRGKHHSKTGWQHLQHLQCPIQQL